MTWILVIQYIHTSVLFAVPGDLRIRFEDSSTPVVSQRSLRISRENDGGVFLTLLDQSVPVNPKNTRLFKPHSVTTQQLPGGIQLKLLQGGKYLAVQTDAFSLSLNPDGQLKLLGRRRVGHLDVETFGKIFIQRNFEAIRLQLAGLSLRNHKKLTVGQLRVRLSKTEQQSASFVNDIEGQIHIGNLLSLRQGDFQNFGRLLGKNGSIFDLHQNDFINGHTGQRLDLAYSTNVDWEGSFTIRNVGQFLNNTSIRQKSSEEGVLRIEAQTVKNLGEMRSNSTILIQCLQNLINQRVITAPNLRFDVRKTLLNRGHIKANRLTLLAGKILNFRLIHSDEKGFVFQWKGKGGIYNHEGGIIRSRGELTVQGDWFSNRGTKASKGQVEAALLNLRLQRFINGGDVTAHEKGVFKLDHSTNSVTGTLHLPADSHIQCDHIRNRQVMQGKAVRMAVRVFENAGRILSDGSVQLEVAEFFHNAKDAVVSCLEHLVLQALGRLQNDGEMISESDIELSGQSILNQGLISSDQDVRFKADHLSNPGEVEGQSIVLEDKSEGLMQSFQNEGSLRSQAQLRILAQRGKNSGELKADGALDFVIGEHLLNESTGQILSLHTVHLGGLGHAENAGLIMGGTELQAHLGSLANSGTLKSLQIVSLLTRPESDASDLDFINHGAVVGHDIALDVVRGLNLGQCTDTIDLTEAEDFQGIVSEGTLSLTLHDTFTNAGQMFAVKGGTLQGEGRFENKQQLLVEGDLGTDLAHFVNQGSVEALRARMGGRELHNRGSIHFQKSTDLRVQNIVTSPDSALTSLEGLDIGCHTLQNHGDIKSHELIQVGGRQLMNSGDIESFGAITVQMDTTVNSGLIRSNERVDITSHTSKETEGPDFLNEGLVKAPRLSLAVDRGRNQTKPAEDGFVSGLVGTEGLSLTVQSDFSNQGLLFGGQELQLTGTGALTNDRALLAPRSLTSGIPHFANRGTVSAGKSHIQGESFRNEGDIALQESSDIGAAALSTTPDSSLISAGELDLAFKALDNQGGIGSKGKLQLVGQTAKNSGDLESQGPITLRTEDATNSGQIQSEQSVEITTHKEGSDPDFHNEGLVKAPQVSVTLNRGVNQSPTESEKGLLATEGLTLTVAEEFLNQGQVVGAATVSLAGDGILQNDGMISHSKVIHSTLPRIVNTGIVRASSSLVIEEAETGVDNSGLLLSEGTLDLKSSGKIQNSGIIEGREGDTGVEAQTLHNEGLLSSASGLLRLSMREGTNRRAVLGHGGVELSFTTSFVNTSSDEQPQGASISSPQQIFIRGEGHLQNEGTIEAEGATELEVSDVTNGPKGRVSGQAGVHIASRQAINRGQIEGPSAEFTTEGSLENSGTITAQETDISLAVGSFSNRSGGQVDSKQDLKITSREGLQNEGQLTSHRDCILEDQGPLINTDQIQATGSLTAHHTEINNSGSLLAGHIALRTPGELYNQGDILAKEGSLTLDFAAGVNAGTGTIATAADLTTQIGVNLTNEGMISTDQGCELTGPGSLTNTKVIQAKQGLRAQVQAIENTGILRGHGVELSTTKLGNSREISSSGPFTLTVTTGENTGTVAGQSLALTVAQYLNNIRTIASGSSLLLAGDGSVQNHGDMLAEGQLTVQKGQLENNGHVQATGAIEILAPATLKTGKDSKLLSRSSIHIKGQAPVINQGIIFGDTLILPYENLTNMGRFEAIHDILFPALTRLNNKPKGVILSKEGALRFPVLQTLSNQGRLESHLSPDFPQLQTFRNGKQGRVVTQQTLTLKVVELLSNLGKLSGKEGQRLESQSVTLGGTVASDGSLQADGNQVKLQGLLRSGKDLTVKGRQALTQTSQGTLETPEGAINLTSPHIRVLGKASGQSTTLRHTARQPLLFNPTHWAGIDRIIIHAQHGCRLQGERRFSSHFEMNGPLLHYQGLQVGGDFTWKMNRSLENRHDLLVGGILNLELTGRLINHSLIQGQRGAILRAMLFHNRGAYYSSGTTQFIFTQGFANWGKMQIIGDWNVTAGHSFENHQGADIQQRNLRDVVNQITFTVGQNIINTSASILLAGTFESRSRAFHNLQAAHVIRNFQREYHYREGEHDTSATKPAREELHQPRATFAAGAATVRAQSLVNRGSTFSTQRATSFEGAHLHNVTTVCNETGTKVVQRSERRKRVERDGRGFVRVKYTAYWGEDQAYTTPLHSETARFHSYGPINLRIQGRHHRGNQPQGPGVENSGEIYTGQRFEQAGGFLVNRHQLGHLARALPQWVDVSEMFTAAGPSLWKQDTARSTAFQVVPRFDQPQPAADVVQQLDEPQAYRDLSGLLNPTVLETCKRTVTSSNMTLCPARIAVLTHPELQGQERMHAHPALVAEQVTRSFLNLLGTHSPVKTLASPELMTRVLEEQGYLNAVELHSKEPQAPQTDWETLSSQDHNRLQIREVVTREETEAFRHPAIVYVLKQVLGEKVLAATLILPQAFRAKFQDISGRILAEYLKAEVQKLENLEGTLAGQTGTELDVTGDVINREGHIGQGGKTCLKVTGQLDNLSAVIDGDETSVKAKSIRHLTYTERQEVAGGYEDHLLQQARIGANSGKLDVTVDEDLAAQHGRFDGKGDVEITVGRNMSLSAAQIESDITTWGKRWRRHVHTLKNHGSEVQSGKNIRISVGQDAKFHGIQADATQSIRVRVQGSLTDGAVVDSYEEKFRKKSKKRRFRGRRKTNIHTVEVEAQGSSWKAEEVDFDTEQDHTLEATQVQSAPQGTQIRTHKGDIHLKGAKSRSVRSVQSFRKGMATQSQKSKGHDDETLVMPQLPKDVQLSSGKQILVDVPIRSRKGKVQRGYRSVESALDQLQSQPNMEWVGQLRSRTDIKWQDIDEAHARWSKSSRSLTPAAMALIGVAIGAATGGLGLASMVGAGTAGAMFSAGVSSLATQAAASLVATKGNIGQTFKNLASVESIKSVAAAVVTAGLMAEIGGLVDGTATDAVKEAAPRAPPSTLTRVQHHLKTAALNNIARKPADIALRGESVQEALKGLASDALIEAIAAFGAESIGEARHPTDGSKPIRSASHKALHGGLGALQGLARAGLNYTSLAEGALSGAMGAAGGELLAEQLSTDLVDDLREGRVDLKTYENTLKQRAQLAKLGMGILAFGAQRDVGLALNAADNSIQHNFLHPSHNPVVEAKRAEHLRLAGEAALTPIPALEEVRDRLHEAVDQTHSERSALDLLLRGNSTYDNLRSLSTDVDHFLVDLLCPTIPLDVGLMAAGPFAKGAKGLAALSLAARGAPKAAVKVVPKVIGGERRALEAIDLALGKQGTKASRTANGLNLALQSTPSRVRLVNGRLPINSKFANQSFPLEQLPKSLRGKHPHSVPFTGTGYPDFSRYAIKKVKIKMTGDRRVDTRLANEAVGLSKTPQNYTWHHHYDGETMMLIDRELHRAVKHTGGVAKVIKHGE